ncbi:uncharacterized protein LOC128546159 isoform X2 [Mercenaria mercenaria]|uniref:uncharacterized protein LOC128546159 isoform X2 n=1 Tax=Mercenaria mercenaria TaxID=6596 RepID=UPI00234EDD8B|nr:uncharacterized protein LOC128546159 isoform X2 [Mercenaria mercenaria]
MSTSGTEKHCRLSCMLIKAGTKTNWAFLEKRVKDLSPDPTSPWSLDDFLKTKQRDIQKSKLSKEKYRVLFPATGATDVKKWDLSLLCHVLVHYCQLSTIESLDVKQFRNVRNELCHAHEPNIDDDKFKNDVETIEIITTRILQKVDNPIITEEVTDIINEMKEGPLSLVETVRTMHIFYSMERDIREKLDTISDAESRLLEAAERIEHKLDSSVVMRADPNYSSSVRLPAVDFYIDIKNIGAEKEARLSEILVELFEATLEGNEDLSTLLTTLPPECFQQLRETVNETFKIFLSRGWEISKVKHENVLLKIQCRTISAVVALFRDFAEGRLLPVLENLGKRCSMLDSYSNVELEPVLYRDTFFDVMEETFSSIEDNMLKEEIAVKSTDTHSLCLSIKPRDTMHLERLKSKQTLDRIQCSLKIAEQILVPHLEEPRLSFESSVEVKEQTPALEKGSAELLDDQFGPLDHESSTDGHLTTLKETEIDKNAEKDCKIEQDSCMRPLGTESGTECDAPDLPAKAIYTLKRYVPSASTSKSAAVELSSYETSSKAQVDSSSRDTLQTIALLELYKSQRAIAHYLELAYLSFYDYPDIENKVLTASHFARVKHRITAYSEWYWLVERLMWKLEDLTICDFSEIDRVIEGACRLKKMTEQFQKSYIELQDIIRNLMKRCENSTSLRKHKEAKARDKKSIRSEEERNKESMRESYVLQSKVNLETSHLTKEEKMKLMIYVDSFSGIRMIDKDASSNYSGSFKFVPKENVKADTFVLDKHTEIAKYSSKHYKGKPEMKIFKQEVWPSKWTPGLKTLKFYEIWCDKETILTMLRPGSALTGGTDLRRSMSNEIFASICSGEEAR